MTAYRAYDPGQEIADAAAQTPGAAAIRTACSSSASWSRCEATATLDQRSKLVFHARSTMLCGGRLSVDCQEALGQSFSWERNRSVREPP